MLALVALFSMTAVSSWHSASIHDDAALSHSVSAHHDHDHGGTDTDSLVHLAAHCFGHSFGLPEFAAQPARSFTSAASWPAQRAAVLTGRAPPSLLRPPEA